VDMTADPWTFWADRTTQKFTPLGPVSVTAAKFGHVLNGFGTGSFTVSVEQKSLSREDLLALWSWRLWVYHYGTPVWCGCPTGISDNGSATVEMTMLELPGYLQRRVLTNKLTYTQVEQTVIAAALAQPVVAVGVTVVTSPGSGVLRDREYNAFEGESRAALLSGLCEVENGAEFRAEYTQDAAAGLPLCMLRIAYPRIGSATGLALTMPGKAVSAAIAWDADEYRTRTYAIGDKPEGAPEAAQKPMRIADRVPGSNVPLLEAVDDWPGVVLTTTLTERANTYANIYGTPALDVKGTVSVTDPPLWTYDVGDDVTVTIIDPLMRRAVRDSSADRP